MLGASQSGRRSSLRLLSVLRDEDVIAQARDDATGAGRRRPGPGRAPGAARRRRRPCSPTSAPTTSRRRDACRDAGDRGGGARPAARRAARARAPGRPPTGPARRCSPPSSRCVDRAGPAAGCSTSTPGPAPSGSRRSAAAPPTRCSSSPTPRRPAPSATTRRRLGLAGAEVRHGRVERIVGGRRRPARRTTSCSPTRPTTCRRRARWRRCSPTCAPAAGRRRAWWSSSARPAAARWVWPAGFEADCAPAATARPRFGTVAPLRADRRRTATGVEESPSVTDAPLRLPRLLRPGDQRAPRRHRAGRRAVRRGRRWRCWSTRQARPVRGRRAHRDARGRSRPTCGNVDGRLLPGPARRLLPRRTTSRCSSRACGRSATSTTSCRWRR